ncbi:MAG: ATPase, partial [Anaerolineaceae bacterium]|nr:ATPase [Anaerolineaceae bacterium]
SGNCVLITGDLALDWHIINQEQNQGDSIGWNRNLWTRACSQIGGAGLLADLIIQSTALDPELQSTTFLTPNFPDQPFHPCQDQFHNAYALWSKFKEDELGQSVWRVSQFLGLDPITSYVKDGITPFPITTPEIPNILVIDDANLGFRDHPEFWPDAIKKGAEPDWIIYKMACPIAQGPLWEHLRDNFAEKLVVVIPVQDLRKSEVHISQGLSWERTAQDIVWELVYNPTINSLGTCSDVIVSFNPAGAVHLTRRKEGQLCPVPEGFLYFDPDIIEGSWRESHKGEVIGYTTCLTSSLAHQIIKNPKNPDLSQGVQSGLSSIRLLHLEGYQLNQDSPKKLQFPIESIAKHNIEPSESFAKVKIQNPVFTYDKKGSQSDEERRNGWWTILEDQYLENLHHIAEKIVLNGIEPTLKNVPLGRFGHLLSVDRQEIESFRSIHNLASEYLKKPKQKKPLSIAVFGAPGSGKSFGITQVAQSLAEGQVEVLEFNLSQFSGPEEIIDALHRVRDVVLSGKIPLVFWDEFDTRLGEQDLGWLRFFLSPMQDGSFRQGQIVHPIGRSLFVFAGGTSHRIDEFGTKLSEEEYRAAKVPDFVSRLKGFVNIMGPNPPENKSESDPYYIIRRAILLRSLLERSAKDLFTKQNGMKVLNIDGGVLKAFLEVDKYKHGIRSIESIITMSSLSGKHAYERSCLPPSDQLNLHVDSVEFLSLVQTMKLQGELLEKLAQANHTIYQRMMIGKSTGTGQDSSQKDWGALPEDEKEQNRNAIKDIPNKLATIGYVMIPSRSNQPVFHFPDQDEDAIALAKIEHQRWWDTKLEMGWKVGPVTDKENKIHATMVPWDELSQEEKDKDIEFVRAIPEILAEAGYTMLKVKQDEKE